MFEVNLIESPFGFSGSPVISRLRDSESTWEGIAELDDNQPCFLGVFSGFRPQNRRHHWHSILWKFGGRSCKRWSSFLFRELQTCLDKIKIR